MTNNIVLNKSNRSLIKQYSHRFNQISLYERNVDAKKICINYWKPVCSVCNTKLTEKTTQVHHIIPESEINNHYKLDSINDLRPICKHCHSLLHIQNPPLTIIELKIMMFVKYRNNNN